MSEESNSNPVRRSVYAILERPSGRRYWLKIGSAYLNRDGSENLYLDALPLGGKLQIREEKPVPEEREREAPRRARASARPKGRP